MSCELASSLSRREKAIVDGHETDRLAIYSVPFHPSRDRSLIREAARSRHLLSSGCVRGSGDNCRIYAGLISRTLGHLGLFSSECDWFILFCESSWRTRWMSRTMRHLYLSPCSGCATPVKFNEPWRTERQSTTSSRYRCASARTTTLEKPSSVLLPSRNVLSSVKTRSAPLDVASILYWYH